MPFRIFPETNLPFTAKGLPLKITADFEKQKRAKRCSNPSTLFFPFAKSIKLRKTLPKFFLIQFQRRLYFIVLHHTFLFSIFGVILHCMATQHHFMYLNYISCLIFNPSTSSTTIKNGSTFKGTQGKRGERKRGKRWKKEKKRRGREENRHAFKVYHL